MSGKTLKKIVSYASALSIIATMVAIPVRAEGNEYFILDSEAATDTSGWTSQYFAEGMSIQTDSSPEINKYFKYLNSTGKGDRTAYYTLPAEAKQVDENQKSVIEFDFQMRNGGTKGNNQLAVLGTSSTPVGNAQYSGDGAIILFYQPMTGGGEFVINENVDIASATDVSSGYVNGEWAHAKAILDFAGKTAIVSVTSLDGERTIVDSTQVNMGSDVTDLNYIFINSARDNSYCSIDNFVVRPLGDSDVTATYYKATFNVDGNIIIKSVVEGEKLTELPDTAKTGYIFDGWYKNDDQSVTYSNEEILDTPLTENVTYTAVYHLDPDYIEPLTSVEFSSFPANGYPVAGADENTAADNIISVKLTGELGTDLGVNPDPRVDAPEVEWEFDGFRTVASKGEPTTDIIENQYCDSYAEVVPVEDDPLSINFKLKSQAFNYYGQVKAKVTYNDKTMEISLPMTILADTAQVSGQLLPNPGYISDFNKYEDTMVGYQATTSADNRTASDIVTDNWAAYGGNTKTVTLQQEEDKKFLRLEAFGTKSSSFAANHLKSIPDGQVIVSQEIRFYNAGSSILYKSVNPVTWTTGEATSASIDFDGNGLKINGSESFASISAGVWYKLVFAVDVTSKLAFAKVYDMDGVLLGESDIMPFSDAGSVTPQFLCYRTPDASMGKLDFNNVKVYVPTMDEATFKTTQGTDTISIPENGAADAATTLTVEAKSTEGYDMIGEAVWTLADENITNVTVTPSADNSHNATLTVSEGAPSGEIMINVSLGGITKQIKVNLTSSQDSVKFIQSTSSISIPMDEGASADYKYEAQIVDGDGNPISGKTVTYAMYDKNNVNEAGSIEGVTFDAATGTLTVTSKAKAQVIYIRATGTNTDGDTINRSVKVTIHGLAFDFGAGTDEDVVEGYTAVTPTTVYTDTSGYGIASGTPTVGGTASIEDPDSDTLDGNFKFQVKVTPAKVYNVTVNYSGTAASEYVNSDLAGIAWTNESKNAVTYAVPVIDDVLDITFSNASVSSIVIEKQDDKSAGALPHIYTVGDSTIANNGSWAYVMNRDYASYEKLPELATFSNNGRGGKNLSTYYTGGEFRDRVLVNIRPGDYVMIGDMGTNGMGSFFEDDFNYYVDACIALGAKVILNSYSPHGCVADYAGGYDAATQTFNSYRQDEYDNIVRAIYAERVAANDTNIVGFVDIGKNADAAFNAYVDDYAANGYDSRDAAAQAIIACFGDHNHYSNGPLAAELMINGYGDKNGIVQELVRILSEDEPIQPPTETPDQVTMTYDEGKITILSTKAQNAVVAKITYDSNNVMTDLEFVEVALEANTAKTVDIDTSVSKAMLVNDLNNLKPLCGSVTISE